MGRADNLTDYEEGRRAAKEMCVCNLIPPRGEHATVCPNYSPQSVQKEVREAFESKCHGGFVHYVDENPPSIILRCANADAIWEFVKWSNDRISASVREEDIELLKKKKTSMDIFGENDDANKYIVMGIAMAIDWLSALQKLLD